MNEKERSTRGWDTLGPAIRAFVAERNWERYHTPKNLSMSIAIEAAELMEHFQWVSEEDLPPLRSDRARVEKIAEELSDVTIYCLRLADVLDVDLAAAMWRKLDKNREKYPKQEEHRWPRT